MSPFNAFELLVTNVKSKKRKKIAIMTNFLLQKLDFKKKFPSYDQFIIQYPLMILHKWQGHCILHTLLFTLSHSSFQCSPMAQKVVFDMRGIATSKKQPKHMWSYKGPGNMVGKERTSLIS
jgi:hypothetical protein